jgi:mono/diheme cytochrome c family protein
MRRQAWVAVAVGLGAAVVFGVTTLTNVTTACAADPISFSQDVLPIFKGRCVACHGSGGEGYEKSGLDLTTYEGLMKGTKVGKMVIPGDPDSSNLVWLLDWKAKPALRMPHGTKKLSTCDRDAIRTWIRQGAKNN